KALEKDRTRRYETSSTLAADVERYLKDEPVQARPSSAWYRLSKFARRNQGKLAISACAAVILLVIAGGVGFNLQERASRAAKAAYAVGVVLGDVARLAQNKQWGEALAAANRAEGILAGSEGSSALQERLSQARAVVEQGLARATTDQKMAAELAEIRLRDV